MTERPDDPTAISANDRLSIIFVGIVLFIVGWGTNVATPFLVLYKQQLDLSDAATVTIFTVYVIGILITLMFAGPLSDRYGRKSVLIPSLALSATASIVLIFGQDSYAWLMIGRILLGVVSGAVFGVGAAWLQELFGPARSATAAIMTTLVTYAGFGIGPPVSALFALAQDNPLTWPFLLHVALSVAIFPLLLRARETVDTSGERPPFALRFGVPQGARRSFWLSIAPVAVWVFGFPSTGFALFPLLVSGEIPGHEVSVAAGSGVLTAWAALSARPIMKRAGTQRSLTIGMAMGVGGYMLGTFAFATGVWPLVMPSAMLLGGASGTITAAVLAKLALMTDPESRGALNSTFYLLAYTGMAMPTVITLIGSVTGRTPALLLVTGMAGAVLLLTLTQAQTADAVR